MGALRSIDRIYFLDAPRGAGSSMSAIYSNSGQIRLRLDVLCANSGYGIASRQPAINRTSAPLPASSICKDRQRHIRTLATAAASSRAPSKPNTPMGPTPDAELHLRAARAEQQVADLNVETVYAASSPAVHRWSVLTGQTRSKDQSSAITKTASSLGD